MIGIFGVKKKKQRINLTNANPNGEWLRPKQPFLDSLVSSIYNSIWCREWNEMFLDWMLVVGMKSSQWKGRVERVPCLRDRRRCKLGTTREGQLTNGIASETLILFLPIFIENCVGWVGSWLGRVRSDVICF